MNDLENGAAPAAPESEVVSTPAPEAAAPAEQAVDIDAELGKVYDSLRPPRDDGGKFASRGDGKPETPAEQVSQEGKPQSDAVETAQAPSIAPPNSVPSELKAQWASVPPAMQEFIAKREAEAHRQITQLGQQAKAYEPLGKLVETNQDVFSNNRRNVDPMTGISQLLEAQRQLDRDPIASIAHIAKVYGVDLSIFGGQPGEPGNQSPLVASLQVQNQDLLQKVSRLEQLVMTREEREAQVEMNARETAINDFLSKTPVSDDLMPEFIATLQTTRRLHPDMPHKDALETAYEKFRWAHPTLRQQALAQQRTEEEAKRAKEQAAKAADAKRSGAINVRSSPGNVRNAKTEDELLSEVYDRMRA